jgi:hypothetical protein
MPILTLTATGSDVVPTPVQSSIAVFMFFHVRFDTTNTKGGSMLQRLDFSTGGRLLDSQKMKSSFFVSSM